MKNLHQWTTWHQLAVRFCCWINSMHQCNQLAWLKYSTKCGANILGGSVCILVVFKKLEAILCIWQHWLTHTCTIFRSPSTNFPKWKIYQGPVRTVLNLKWCWRKVCSGSEEVKRRCIIIFAAISKSLSFSLAKFDYISKTFESFKTYFCTFKLWRNIDPIHSQQLKPSLCIQKVKNKCGHYQLD